MSKMVSLSTSKLSSIAQLFTTCLIDLKISVGSCDDFAISKIFSSLTTNGLKASIFPVEGIFNSYVGCFSFGKAMI